MTDNHTTTLAWSTSCNHANNGQCDISTKLANFPVPLAEDACRVCTARSTPQTYNDVTYGKAISTLVRAGKEVPRQLVEQIIPYKDGPGTELKKLISWFIWDAKASSCKKCLNRERKMNQWGPETCLERINTIKRWLKHSAIVNAVPYSDRIVTALIKRAIRISIQKANHAKMENLSNNRT